MKKMKKLINGAVVVGLTLGNSSGPVVSAASILNSTENSTTKKITQQKEKTISTASKKAKKLAKASEEAKKETKKETKQSNTKNITPSLNASKEVPTFNLAKPIPDSIQVGLNGSLEYEAGQQILGYLFKKVVERFNASGDSYTVGDTISYEVVNSGIRPRNAADFFKTYDDPYVNSLGETSIIAILSDALPYKGTHYDNYKTDVVTSESGNWQVQLMPSDDAYSDISNKGSIYVTFTRLKIAPPQEETFNIPKITYQSMWTNTTENKSPMVYLPWQLKFSFPSTESVIGKIKVKVKEGDHELEEKQVVPKPEEFVTAENTRGKVTYEWVTKPDTSKPGKQNVKIVVKDETGRSTEVTFPITVTELLSIKKSAGEIYQYDGVPDVKDYFNVTTKGTYTLKWDNNLDTSTPGTYNWNATVKTADGREDTKTITMNILPHPGLLVKLKPMEDRTLVGSYPSISENFKDYIDEVTMLGKPVDINNLQFVAAESTEGAFSTVGQHEVKITVQAKHPVANVMIKGTGTTTVNVKWGNAFLVRSANGHSAGAFALNVGDSNNADATLTIYPGLDSPLNEGVGDPKAPYDLYYNLEILRNGNSVYNQDVTNRATLQEIINAYGNKENSISVKMGDIIKIHHPKPAPNSSVVMVNEQEKDYTYGSEYAYYKVTPYGFDPAPVLSAESAEKDFVLGEDTSQINPKELVKNVTINGAVADEANYTVENLSDFDTKTVGKRTMKVKITTKDGLASKEVDVSYRVKWGSTFVVKGLNDATVGAFSLLKNKDQWQIQASQGIEGTNLDDSVNNVFGRDTYYSIDVLRGATSTYFYGVAGNQSIRESINGFNDGKPLSVNKGDVIKVYHAEPVGKNLLMEDELAKDYTIGSNYAYYEVTDHGLEAILAITAESSPQEFVLGEDGSNIDGTKLVNSIVINGTPVTKDKYTVTQMSDFDTSVAGEKNIRVRIDTKDGMISKEIDVPYTVKWGESFLVKSSTGGSAGAFSLLDGKEFAGTTSNSKVLKISAGLDSSLDEKINEENGANTYYSIDITRGGHSIYTQEMPGRATLKQVIDNFGNGSNLVTVQSGDIITVNQPTKIAGSSILWQDEVEKDFTYGSETARYQVTDYGLEPAPELGGTTANKQLKLAEQPENVELNQLLSEVTVNGHAVADDLYTVKQLTDFDTKTIGKKEVKLQLALKDGYATTEVDIPYEVKWGESLVMKGLNNATVGVYSFVKRKDQWYIYATQGDPDADLNNWVNNEFGRNVYYRMEIDEGQNSLPNPSEPLVATDTPVTTGNFTYDVTGNMTFGQAITGFNNGQPLPISTGAVIKVYHADVNKNNLLIQDDVVRDYTAGLNYAYYRLTDSGIQPITDLEAQFTETNLTLGEDTTDTDVNKLIENVKFNNQDLKTDLYKAETVDQFDTSTVGHKELKVKLTTADNVTTKEIKVPYTVKWGSSLVMKNKDNETIGAFSLTKEGNKLQLSSLQGKNKNSLSKRLTNINDKDVYYSIEVLNQNKSKYKYEVRGAQTIDQAISRFNGGKPLSVSVGDQIKVYHREPSGNTYMYEETEQNYTYGSNYAYYNVTDYGFDPTGELTVTPVTDPQITKGAKQVDLKTLFKDVKVNGKSIPKNSYSVSLEPETSIDTSAIGKKTAKMTVTADKAYGGFSAPAEMAYNVVEAGTNGAIGDTNLGAGTGTAGANNAEGGNATADGSLPKTNEKKSAVFSVLGVLLVSAAGILLFWKKRKTTKE